MVKEIQNIIASLGIYCSSRLGNDPLSCVTLTACHDRRHHSRKVLFIRWHNSELQRRFNDLTVRSQVMTQTIRVPSDVKHLWCQQPSNRGCGYRQTSRGRSRAYNEC